MVSQGVLLCVQKKRTKKIGRRDKRVYLVSSTNVSYMLRSPEWLGQ